MRRAFHDAMVSAAALIALLALLVAVDGRVRQHVVSQVVGGHPAADVVSAGTQVHTLASVILDAASDTWRLHPALATFVVAATVLTVFMVRT